MKTGLKRIEATLDQLNTHVAPQGAPESSHLESGKSVGLSAGSDAASLRSIPASKQTRTTIQPFPFPQDSQPVVEPVEEKAVPLSAAKPKSIRSSKSGTGSKSSSGSKSGTKVKKASLPHPVAETVQPFPAEQNCPDTPALPKSKPPSFSSHRHAVNPNLALGLIKEVEAVVMQWQLDLEQTILEIQALYLEGPIVEGWLESHAYDLPPVTPVPGMATLRHAEPEQLLQYIEEICRTPQTLDLEEAPRTGYRLCGLDADGQLWSRPCPPQQVPYVSLAIARYQKLRILFAKKQNLESRLNQLIQNLTLLHGQMQEQA